jgi:hypothetical protein
MTHHTRNCLAEGKGYCPVCRPNHEDADATWGNDRIAKAEFIREAMQQTGCLAITAAQRWEALLQEQQLSPPTPLLLCDCVTGRKGRSPEAGHDLGCATGLGG